MQKQVSDHIRRLNNLFDDDYTDEEYMYNIVLDDLDGFIFFFDTFCGAYKYETCKVTFIQWAFSEYADTSCLMDGYDDIDDKYCEVAHYISSYKDPVLRFSEMLAAYIELTKKYNQAATSQKRLIDKWFSDSAIMEEMGLVALENMHLTYDYERSQGGL